jgi:hypothetical protein
MSVKTAIACASIGAMLSLMPASAADRRVKIVNGTSVAMTEFYASNAGTDEWEEDILGEDVLGPGESVMVDIDDGSGYCRFDFKGVFDDGTDAVKRKVDVCTVATFTFTE